MRILAWYGLVMYILIAVISFLGVLIFDDGKKRAETFIRLLVTSPVLIFFLRYLF